MTGAKDRASTTAFIVAVGLAKLSRLPKWKPYFSDRWTSLNEKLLLHSCDSIGRNLLLRLPPAVAIALMDFLFIPGMTQHFLFRKLLIEAEVRRSLRQGTRQVLLLGSGLDTLALRIAEEFPEVLFCEFDRSGTLEQKLNAMKQTGIDLPENCSFLAGDLFDLESFRTKFADVPTLVVLEGVLMYFPKNEVEVIFRTLGQTFSQLRILFGATTSSDEKKNIRVRWVNAALRRQQEGSHWHCSSRELPQFLHQLGFKLCQWLPYKRLQAQFRAEQELLPVPEEDENYYIAEKALEAEFPFPSGQGVEFIKFEALRPGNN